MKFLYGIPLEKPSKIKSIIFFWKKCSICCIPPPYFLCICVMKTNLDLPIQKCFTFLEASLTRNLETSSHDHGLWNYKISIYNHLILLQDISSLLWLECLILFASLSLLTGLRTIIWNWCKIPRVGISFNLSEKFAWKCWSQVSTNQFNNRPIIIHPSVNKYNCIILTILLKDNFMRYKNKNILDIRLLYNQISNKRNMQGFLSVFFT